VRSSRPLSLRPGHGRLAPSDARHVETRPVCSPRPSSVEIRADDRAQTDPPPPSSMSSPLRRRPSQLAPRRLPLCASTCDTATALAQSNLPDRLVGIAGGSCSGKTTLEHNLAAILGDRLALFSFDDMFIGFEALSGLRIEDWEDPNLYRWDDFANHVRDLKAGRAVTIVANSRESTAAGIARRRIDPRPIVAVVGFLTLYHPTVRNLFDTTIYVDVPEGEIIRRRLSRADPDSPWDSVEYINEMLIPGHRRVVLPQREFAEYVVRATVPRQQLANEVVAIIVNSATSGPAPPPCSCPA
jgi:uridine kinase